MIEDPIKKFFDIAQLPPIQVEEPSPPIATPEQLSMCLSESIVAEDVQLVRKQLRSAIEGAGHKIPDMISLAVQMQEPEMIKAAASFLTAFSKLNKDLIDVDIAVLSKTPKPTVILPGATVEEGGVSESDTVAEKTTDDIMKLFKIGRGQAVSYATVHGEDDAKTRTAS